jgi:hypothetical protein
MRVVDYLHGNQITLQSDYEKIITSLCSKISVQYSEVGGSFIYQSAKDQLRWHNISIKNYISDIMTIGNLFLLSDKDWETYKSDNNYIGITKEELIAFMEK